ncbi:MAG: hypothetical protein IJF18_01870 [Oscillospiraceae bacterium]|nr:hypothetical protein [Oscillospiraceae bacterium]
MKVYKCSSCGAELEFEIGSNISVCSYCGTKNSNDEDGVFIGWNPDLTKNNAEENNQIQFSMAAENVFSPVGRGPAAVGQISFGSVKLNDRVKVISDNGSCTECTVSEIEQFRKKLDFAKKGDSIGLVLSDITRQQICKGVIIIKGELDIVRLNNRIKSYYVPINDRVGAINYYMQVTGLGLKDAKLKVDNLFAAK